MAPQIRCTPLDWPEDGRQLQSTSNSNYSSPFGNYRPRLLDMLMDDSSTLHDRRNIPIPPHPDRSHGPSPPPELDVRCKRMLHQAEVHLKSGNLNAARDLCSRVMFLYPDSHYPYVVLARISVNTDKTAYKNYLVTASQLYEHDPSVWCGLAELEAESGNKKNAIEMYSKAVRDAPKEKAPHLRRISLAAELDGPGSRLVLEYKKHMAECLPESDFEDVLLACKELALTYSEIEETAHRQKAIDTLHVLFERFPEEVTPAYRTLILNLFYRNDQFLECTNFMLKYLGFTLDFETGLPDGLPVVSYKAPSDVDIHVKVMFIMCLVKLKAFDSAKPLVDETFVEENVGKLFPECWEVAEDLLEAGLLEPATKLSQMMFRFIRNIVANVVYLQYYVDGGS